MADLCKLGGACILVLLAIDTCSGQPDLIINRWRLERSFEIEKRNFSEDDCAVQEGCVRAPGRRKILLFEVAFANIGPDDLVIGAPEDNLELFEHSPCHNHYHLRGAASYALLTKNGQTVLTGRKQAFCFRDIARLSGSSPPSSGYDCGFMGITAGWEDVYDKSLDCQWLDISSIPPGKYFLRVTVNPRRLLEESNYGNNTTLVPVTIPRAGTPQAGTAPQPASAPQAGSAPQPTPSSPPPVRPYQHLRWLFR